MKGVIPLLVEYTSKLQELVHEADQVKDEYLRWIADQEESVKSDHQKQLQSARWQHAHERLSRLQSHAQHLTHAVQDLDRRVSQMIEHGELASELDRVELKLRLNDLEAWLDAARGFNTYVPSPS